MLSYDMTTILTAEIEIPDCWLSQKCSSLYSFYWSLSPYKLCNVTKSLHSHPRFPLICDSEQPE